MDNKPNERLFEVQVGLREIVTFNLKLPRNSAFMSANSAASLYLPINQVTSRARASISTEQE